MRYSLNELLAEEDIAALTAETFEPKSRPGPKHIRRFAALAACAVLIVGALNFGAIAAGVQKMWQYVIGIGAVEAGKHVDLTVQQGEIKFDDGERTYVIAGAYNLNGRLYLPIDTYSKVEESESITLSTALSCNGERYAALTIANLLGPDVMLDAPTSSAPFSDLREWGVPTRAYETDTYLKEYRAVAESAFWFEIGDATPPYTLSLTDVTGEKTWNLTLELAVSEVVDAIESDRETEQLNVTALVAKDGSRVTLLGELRPDAVPENSWVLNLRGSVVFVDELGNRSAGIDSGSLRGGVAAEWIPEMPLPGKVVRVEITAVNCAYAIGLETPQRRRENGKIVTRHSEIVHTKEAELDWTIPVE